MQKKRKESVAKNIVAVRLKSLLKFGQAFQSLRGAGAEK